MNMNLSLCCHLDSQFKLIYDIIYMKFLVIFDQPDGSTSWGYIKYDSSVKFDSPDCSTYSGINIIIF